MYFLGVPLQVNNFPSLEEIDREEEAELQRRIQELIDSDILMRTAK